MCGKLMGVDKAISPAKSRDLSQYSPNEQNSFPFCAFLAANHRLSKEHS